MVNQTDNGAGDTGSTGCPTVEEQLTKVTDEIVEFEAQKLGELKAELEQVKKKKEDSIKEYKAKFEGLKKQWCEQNDHILSIRRDIIGAFPKWDTYIAECVCKFLGEKRQLENRIACRSEIRGRFEKARDEAKAKLDAAQKVAANWQNATKLLTEQLTSNAKTIEEICKLTCSPDRAVAIYRLWFKLLPAHARIRPVTDCFNKTLVPVTEMCDQLCKPGDPVTECRNCDQYEPPLKPDDKCAPKPPAEKESGDTAEAPQEPDWPQGDPWLVPPDDFGGKIDCAYHAYLSAKTAFGVAERCAQSHPDSLGQVKKELEGKLKTLDADIEDCLKGKKDKGCCEEEDEKKDENKDPCKPRGNNGPAQTGRGA